MGRPSVSLSFHRLAIWSISQFVSPSVFPSVGLSVHVFFPSVSLSFRQSIGLSVNQFVSPSVVPSVGLSVHIFPLVSPSFHRLLL